MVNGANTPNIASIDQWVDMILIMNAKLVIGYREQGFACELWLSSHPEMAPTTHWQ